MGEHGQRYEDLGWRRVIQFWPLIVSIFLAGAWYQSARTQSSISDTLQAVEKDHETRLIRVEDAVVYLKTIVQEDRRTRNK